MFAEGMEKSMFEKIRRVQGRGTLIMKYKNKIYQINIIRMSYPILLNYLLNTVFELLDKAIVGHYSVQGFAVVGIAASAIYAVTGALGILASAFHILAAEEKGKQNDVRFEQIFRISKQLALVIGVGFFLISMWGGRFFFRTIYGLEGEVLQELLSYFYPAAFTVLQNMLIFQYSVYFRNCLDTKITLYSTVVSTGVNLFFDYFLVYGVNGLPKLGTAGAAWGSVIGLFAGLLVYQIAYTIKSGPVRKKFFVHLSPDIPIENRWILKRICKLYPSLLGQELLESTVFVMVLSGVVTRLGTEQMAVYNLLETVGSMVGLPVYAYAAAAQTLALQKQSTGKKAEAKKYLENGVFLGFCTIFCLSILCGVFQNQVFGWIVSDGQIIERAGKILWLIFVIQMMKVPYQVLMNYLQGIGKEQFVFLCTATGTVMAGGCVILLGNWLGLWGVYLAILAETFVIAGIYVRTVKDMVLMD